MLADLGIVEVTKGSGCTVLSKEKAEQFRMQFSDFDSVDSLRRELTQQIEDQTKSLQGLKETIQKLTDSVGHYQYKNPLQPMKMSITEDCRYLGQSIGSIQLWQHTGVTIVAIENQDKTMIISPGPYATFTAGEEIYFIGPTDSWLRLERFLYNTDENEA